MLKSIMAFPEQIYQLPALTPEFPAIVAGLRVTLAIGFTSFCALFSAQAPIGPGERADALSGSKSHWEN